MTKVYLIEIAGMTTRVFADKGRAIQYMECMQEEWDDELGEARYTGYEIDLVEMDLE